MAILPLPARLRQTAPASALVALPMLAACAGLPGSLPPELRPPPGQRALEALAARGVQIYECRATEASPLPRWTFVAPEAQLIDAGGRVVGSHGAGPHWQAFDGSAVVGTVAARRDAPSPDAVPWLLLSTRSTGGAGRFERVSSIQRLNTIGGAAPAAGCTVDSVGTQVRVPYQADYHLFASA